MRRRIALCLLTCERYDYAVRTVESFAAHNDLSRFELLHADDASSERRIVHLAQSYGFRTVRRVVRRVGVMAMNRVLVKAAADLGCDWTLILQADFETVAPFPWELFAKVAADPAVWCLRLYGAYKERDGRRKAGTAHRGKGNREAVWTPYADGAEIGDIHWGAPPCVARTEVLREVFRDAATAHVAMRRSGAVELLTVRLIENACYHIGETRTPGFLA